MRDKISRNEAQKAQKRRPFALFCGRFNPSSILRPDQQVKRRGDLRRRFSCPDQGRLVDFDHLCVMVSR